MWPGHGPIDLRRALAVSCNPYFEWVGEQLGYAKVQQYAHLLGLGERSGHQPRGRDGGGRARYGCARRRRPPVEPRRRHRHLGTAARGAALGLRQRRHRVPAPGGARAPASSPRALAAAAQEPVIDGLAGRLRRGRQRRQRAARLRPRRGGGRQDGDAARSLGWFASYAPAAHARGRGRGRSCATAAATARPPWRGRIYQELFKPGPGRLPSVAGQ